MCFNLDANLFYADSTISEIVEKSIVYFLDKGFLEIGGYINVAKGQTNPAGRDMSALSPITVTGITHNTIWRGIKNNWIWESSNLTFKYTGGTAPYVPSGIYFNNTFVPTGTSITGTGYVLDFTRGQVVFNNPVPSNSSVQVRHSLRAVSVYSADSNEYRKSVADWQNGVDTDINFKAYYPAIFVEVIGSNTIRGTQLGSRGKFINADVQFEIFATSNAELRKLLDIIYMMETKVITLIDIENFPRPLNHQGELIRPNTSYTEWTTSYALGNGRFAENAVVYKQRNQNIPIHRGRVRIGLEFDVVPI